MGRVSFRLLTTALAVVVLACAVAPGAAAAGTDGLALTAEERAFIDSCGPLKVGYVQDRIPVSFQGADGSLAGISRHIFDRIGELTGFVFDYAPLPTGDVTYDYLQSEGFDLVTSVEYNEENKKANGILISRPYLSTRKVVVARDDLAFSFDAALSVAISSGSQTIHKVLGEAYPSFSLEDYGSITDCFQAVRDGQADMTIQNQFVVEYWISKPAYEDLKVIPVLGMDDELCFSAVVAFDGGAARPETEGRRIIDLLDRAIATLTEDEVGSYTIQGVMENQYRFTLGDFLYRYRYAAAALGLSALVIAALAALLIRQRLRSMEDRADAKAKGEFLSAMSHELRTPLNGIIGLNYLMDRDLDDRERVAGYLRKSSATAEYLLQLVSDILDMSSLQAGDIKLARRPVELEGLFDTVISIVQSGMAEKGVAFETDIAIDHPCVLGDPVRVEQVLLQLLDNARKFTPAGGRIALRVDQSQAPDGQVITRAEVSDTGQGMSQEFLEHIFDTFVREDTVSKGNGGTGMGLPVSYHLAALMGGSLTAESQKDQGSRFVFTFPGIPSSMDPAEAAPAETARKAGMRVLVAEDNELNGEIIMEVLEGEGFRPSLAHNGRETLDTFARSAPDHFGAILMDLVMPEMDGFQAAAAIRALDRPDAKTVRLIACTANDTAEDRARALACGMDGFLSKPVDVNELINVLG